jgi:hypothetical protein
VILLNEAISLFLSSSIDFCLSGFELLTQF